MFGFLRKLFRRGEEGDGLERLERRIGYAFRDRALLAKALSHRSYLSTPGNSSARSNERLEYLGDAVVGAVVSEQLFRDHPQAAEGELTRRKAALVSHTALHLVATAVDLGSHLRLSPEEARAGGRNRASILSDAFEALVGAVFLDGGWEAAHSLVLRTVVSRAGALGRSSTAINFKGALLEHAQAHRMGAPRYTVVERAGPDHEAVFTVTVSVNGNAYGTGVGRSKKSAEQRAAAEALATLGVPPPSVVDVKRKQ